MARKSNKTAHVLNLIAGQEVKKDSPEEVATEEVAVSAEPAADPTPAASTASASTNPPATSPAPAAQNISVIDTTSEDPVAELIQQQLASEFENHHIQAVAADDVSIPSVEETTTSDTPSQSETIIEKSGEIPASELVEESVSTPVPAEITEEAEPHVDTVQPSVAVQAPSDTVSEVSAPSSETATTATPESPDPTITIPEPEPDFVAVNMMERIVKDKIIYFMRQFDVCTCDRCVADTIALTLNGLMPKYIVTTPAAVDPLVSFNTNRYIVDVTVEATKACAIVKENPRH
ncbi:MAG: hypothetical protein HFH53_12160 [Hespellia sp.]|jgi:hypothetical protein|nr:hypothetical protein [Hespellia sp.]